MERGRCGRYGDRPSPIVSVEGGVALRGVWCPFLGMKKFLLSFALLTFGLSIGGAEESIPGLEVGERAPEFTLPSATGEDVSLKALLEGGPVALVFVRSADWCPHCRRQLTELEAARAEVEAGGGRVIALSYDAVETNAAAAKKLELSYPLLSDVGSKVIEAYGIRNLEAKGRGEGIPHPTVFVVDTEGEIRAKIRREGHRDRPESAEITAAFESL